MMAGIRGRHTQPEVTLRKALHAMGFRFRLHDRRLPGRPDIVLPRFRVAIQVHGCFWHRHPGCRLASSPATRPDFWQAKFAANIERDESNLAKLRAAGWRTAVIWECALRDGDVGSLIDGLCDWIRSDESCLELPKALRIRWGPHKVEGLPEASLPSIDRHFPRI
jgi:DNA mismatch endonuclease (patch repair protein)